ncbi:hypothetical protein [Silvibacterium acidisoli]|uniref:hypothetical protein n=1 Tax=Acidobacteriaceae bacterium ZG23-2 TaxID=2883246 RepID=UPI00406CB379
MAFDSEVMHELEEEYSGEGEEEYEDESSLEGEGWLGAIGNVVGSLLGESEGEDEYESESAFEAEGELNPMRKIYPDAMMEHLGELAAEAESEEEAAEHFLPLIGMAASKLLPVVAKAIAPAARKALPKIAGAVMRSSPRLTKGIGSIAKTLHRNPQTRYLLKTVPTIARRTVGSIARQVTHGRQVTPQRAVRTLANQARYVLGHPQHRKHALRRHNRLEQTFHRRFARGMVRPHGHIQYRYQGRPVPGQTTTYYAAGGVQAPGSVTYGQRTSTGQCACGSGSSPAPAYCRCCGQVLR